MKLKYFYIIIIILIQYSCEKNKDDNEIKITYLNPILSKKSFNDSIYFSEIVSIENINNEYFLVDLINHIVINIDSTFNFIQTIGSQGRGPGEFLHPFNVFNINNHIYISDAANRRINIYFQDEGNKYKFKDAIDIDYLIQDNRSLLMLNDSIYYCSTPGEEGPVRMNNTKTGNCNYFGKFYRVTPKNERNIRFIIKDKKLIYVIGVSEPIIEKYNIQGELINRTSLVHAAFFDKIMKEHQKIYKNHPTNTTPYLFTDVSVVNDIVYLLVTERFPSGLAQSNKILILEPEENKYKLKKIFDLGNGQFSSFCISKNMKILAFNKYLGEIQVYNFPN